MLHYPKIPGTSSAPVGRCVAFDKLDGTNLHWCWERDFGWHAFGTRRDEFNLIADGTAQFNAAHPGLEEAAPVFLATLAEPLEAILRDYQNYASFASAKAFTEFVGAESFAGVHKPGDSKRTVLFDVWLEGYGFVAPQQFVADFGHLSIPRVVYTGKLTGAFLEAVREGKIWRCRRRRLQGRRRGRGRVDGEGEDLRLLGATQEEFRREVGGVLGVAKPQAASPTSTPSPLDHA